MGIENLAFVIIPEEGKGLVNVQEMSYKCFENVDAVYNYMGKEVNGVSSYAYVYADVHDFHIFRIHTLVDAINEDLISLNIGNIIPIYIESVTTGLPMFKNDCRVR